MKSLTEHLTFNLPARMGFVNITHQVEEIVERSGVREGLCLVNAMHITASVFINDDETGLHEDYAAWLEKLAPFNSDPKVYRHNRTGEDNADAHMKRQVMGREVVVAVTEVPCRHAVLFRQKRCRRPASETRRAAWCTWRPDKAVPNLSAAGVRPTLQVQFGG
jgi:secondary thiamine-phosphate synthase enzyme